MGNVSQRDQINHNKATTPNLIDLVHLVTLANKKVMNLALMEYKNEIY